MNQKKAIIIGAGSAGLTAAYELLEKTDIKPIVYEMSNETGGISEVKATAMGNFKQQLKDLSRQFVGYLFTGS